MALFLLLVAFLLVPSAVAPQTPARDPLATLRTWADGVWISVLDRDGSWDGRLSDRGVLQRFNPDEDSEYQLDMHTALFSASEDARWAARPMGLRGATGSINHPHIAQMVAWRERYPIASGWALEGDFLRERTLRASRDHVRAGLFWQPGSTEAWEVGATLGLHFFKPSADLELVAARSWAEGGDQRGRLEV